MYRKISQLTEATNAGNEDVLPVVSAGHLKKITKQNLLKDTLTKVSPVEISYSDASEEQELYTVPEGMVFIPIFFVLRRFLESVDMSFSFNVDSGAAFIGGAGAAANPGQFVRVDCAIGGSNAPEVQSGSTINIVPDNNGNGTCMVDTWGYFVEV